MERCMDGFLKESPKTSGGDVGEARDIPCEAIVRLVQSTGRHFLSEADTDALGRLRAGTEDRFGRALLDCVLDKADGRYAYPTYLALPVLQDPVHPSEDLDVPTFDQMSLLVADVIRFEVGAVHRWHDTLPEERPGVGVARKRVRLGLRCIARAAPADRVPAQADLEGWTRSESAARRLIAHLPEPGEGKYRRRIDASMLPVYVQHDEYMFIRVLQSYETVFTSLVKSAASALNGLRSQNLERTCQAIDFAADAFDRASHLFSLLATMRPASFRTFREFTDGASAIQSEHYKKFELLCGVPRRSRLESEAFASVPGVQEIARSDPDTISRAYAEESRKGWGSHVQWQAFRLSTVRLEQAHQRWKTTHYRLAQRMLGDIRGSGYTAGVPYLKSVLGNRLFWQLGDGTANVEGDRALS